MTPAQPGRSLLKNIDYEKASSDIQASDCTLISVNDYRLPCTALANSDVGTSISRVAHHENMDQ